MSEEQVEIFLKLQPQLNSTYQEMSLLSKKKPSDTINKFKLKFINSILSRANSVLNEYKPFPGEFDLFDEAELPNNGDVVLMFSHYLTSLEKLRCDNIEKNEFHEWYWVIDGERSDKKTTSPRIH